MPELPGGRRVVRCDRKGFRHRGAEAPVTCARAAKSSGLHEVGSGALDRLRAGSDRARARARVRFVIVGGLAVTIYGSSYVAFDLDFRYVLSPEILWAMR